MKDARTITLPAAILLAASILAASVLLSAFLARSDVTVHLAPDGTLEAISGDPGAVSAILDLRK